MNLNLLCLLFRRTLLGSLLTHSTHDSHEECILVSDLGEVCLHKRIKNLLHVGLGEGSDCVSSLFIKWLSVIHAHSPCIAYRPHKLCLLCLEVLLDKLALACKNSHHHPSPTFCSALRSLWSLRIRLIKSFFFWNISPIQRILPTALFFPPFLVSSTLIMRPLKYVRCISSALHTWPSGISINAVPTDYPAHQQTKPRNTFVSFSRIILTSRTSRNDIGCTRQTNFLLGEKLSNLVLGRIEWELSQENSLQMI